MSTSQNLFHKPQVTKRNVDARGKRSVFDRLYGTFKPNAVAVDPHRQETRRPGPLKTSSSSRNDELFNHLYSDGTSSSLMKERNPRSSDCENREVSSQTQRRAPSFLTHQAVFNRLYSNGTMSSASKQRCTQGIRIKPRQFRFELFNLVVP